MRQMPGLLVLVAGPVATAPTVTVQQGTPNAAGPSAQPSSFLQFLWARASGTVNGGW